MWRSGYLPRVLGALWVLSGRGFVAGNVVCVLGPPSVYPLLLAPQVLAALSLGLCLLVRGVDAVTWQERGAIGAYGSVAS